MKFFVKTKEKKDCEVALKEFAELIRKEYDKQTRFTKRFARKVLPSLICTTQRCDDGIILDVPVPIPDMKTLRRGLETILHKKLGEPKYQKKMLNNLESFLKEKRIKFESVTLAE
jgi:hypothetical protein